MSLHELNIDNVIANHASQRLFDGGFGLEKENLRITPEGKLTTTPHPEVLGDKLHHPYITTDFSESQIEMVTPVLSNITEALGFLETIHDEVSIKLDNEYLWPQSSPPQLPENEDEIPIARFGSSDRRGQELEQYRHHLAQRYGRKKQMFCGVHFNISFNEKVIRHIYEKGYQTTKTPPGYESFREQVYLKTLRNFKRYRWFLIALLGNSPAVHRSYVKKCVEQLPRLNEEAVHHTHACSMRNGICGYRNKKYLKLDYHSVAGLNHSINKLIDQGVVKSIRENYASARIKLIGETDRISHLEIRLLDLNPMLKSGIDDRHLRIIHQFLIFCLLKPEDQPCDHVCLSRAFENHERAATSGLNPDTNIILDSGEEIPIENALTQLFDELELLTKKHLPETYRESQEHLRTLITNPESRPAAILLNQLSKNSYLGWTVQQAQHHLEQSKRRNYNFHGFEDMELSTQLLLREAVIRGIDIEIMDRAENFIKLSHKGQEEYVMQATRTSLDNYASVLLMENKVMTKKVLNAASIRTPDGDEYDSAEAAKADFVFTQGQAIVIKPKSTNFGLGITILKKNQDPTHYNQAVDIAFKYDQSILVEAFVPGKEYRIFLINGEVAGILHRVPANVIGDGQSTIAQLISKKNEDPLRGKGYRTPLEKIALGEEEVLFLATQGYDFTTIPIKNQTVYLRENSNISTGGDSIDVTDDIPDSYKNIAIRAAKALNVNITGLDMMIEDATQEAHESNYAIIEMNFNPAIHIHCHPYQGKNRHLSTKILDALFAQQ